MWHERLVLEHIDGDNYVVAASPDRDVFVEELGLLNSDVRHLRVMPGAGVLFGDVLAAETYPAWGANELANLRAEGR